MYTREDARGRAERGFAAGPVGVCVQPQGGVLEGVPDEAHQRVPAGGVEEAEQSV